MSATLTAAKQVEDALQRYNDPSCPDHPFHTLALSVLEGTNKSLSRNEVSCKELQNDGVLFFVYENQYEKHRMGNFIDYLNEELVIYNVKKHDCPQSITYQDLLNKTTSISHKFSSMKNKVYVINCQESFKINYKNQPSWLFNSNDFRKCLNNHIQPNINSINSKTIFDAHSFDVNKSESDPVQSNIDSHHSNYPLYPKCTLARNKLPTSNTFNDYISVDIAANHQLLGQGQRLNLVVVLDECMNDRSTSIINECMTQIERNLNDGDKFGIVTFDDNGGIIVSKPLSTPNAHNAASQSGQSRKKSIHSKSDNNRFSAAFMEAVKLLNHASYNSYDNVINRIMIISDTEHGPDDDELYALNEKYSRKLMNIPIFSSFVAINSWTSFDVDKIYQTRGSNYFCIDSYPDVCDKIQHQFNFMRSPLVFDLELKIECGNNCKIEKMYGNKRIYNLNYKTFAYQLWHSQTRHQMTIMKLKQLNQENMTVKKENDVISCINNCNDYDEELVSKNAGKRMDIETLKGYNIEYEFNLTDQTPESDVEASISVKSTQNAILLSNYLAKFNHLTDDDVEYKDNTDDDECDVFVTLKYTDINGKEYNVTRCISVDRTDRKSHFDTPQIRKAVLLTDYGKVIKAMMAKPSHGLYQYIKHEYIPYFAEEMRKCRDSTLSYCDELSVLENFLLQYDPDTTTTAFVSKHESIINKYNPNKQMIIGYNPLQNVVVTSRDIKYISHPIHLYKAAYNEGLINDIDISTSYSNWSTSLQKRAGMNKCSVDESLQLLLRLNRYFLIILVPNMVEIDPEYLNKKCIKFNPVENYYQMDTIDFAADLEKYAGKCIFIYRGRFFFNPSLNEKDCKNMDMHIDDLNRNIIYDESSLNKKDLMIYKQNMNPIIHWLIIGCGNVKISRLELLVFGFLNKYSKQYIPFDLANLIYMFYGRKIIYSNSNSNKNYFTRASSYNSDFSDSFKKMLFLCDIDFKMPYNTNIIDDKYRCGICKDLVIDPCKISNKWMVQTSVKLSSDSEYFSACSHDYHSYCRNCMSESKQCTMCHKSIGDQETFISGVRKLMLTKDNDLKKEIEENIPITIYNQIEKENNIRCLNRKYIFQLNGNQ